MAIDPKRNIKIRAHKFSLAVYKLTDNFPKEELYVLTSQLRRAALSVPANIIEGSARNRKKLFVNHLEISYASLAECKYFLYFSFERNYINRDDYRKIIMEADEVSRMLWSSITTVISKYND
jgi:four helix bundle protein